MSVINKLSSVQGIKSDGPNIELAEKIVKKNGREGILELVENLDNKDKRIQSNCIKVLYEIGYRKPELISDHVETFLKLIKSKNNRLVWGSMIALSGIATVSIDSIWKNIDEVISIIEKGSVITQDAGIRVIANISASRKEFEAKLFPFLMKFLKTTISRDVPKYGESILVTINDANKDEFIKILESREKELKPAQLSRVKKLFKGLV